MHLESPNELIRDKYWLGSADRMSRYIFDQQLFVFYDLLQKNNPGLSEYGFLKTLEQYSERYVLFIVPDYTSIHTSLCRKDLLIQQHSARPLMSGGIANIQCAKKSAHPCSSVLAACPFLTPFIWMAIRSFIAIAKFPGTYVRMYAML